MTNTVGIFELSRSDRSESRLPSMERIREQVQRVVESRTFQRATRLKSLLEYVVKGALNGDSAGQLRTARELFGKSDDFDPSIDPVVRVQFGRLRRTLRNYYATEGMNDSVIIEVPSRQYTPVFQDAKRSPKQAGAASDAPSLGGPTVISADRPLIAVMPFANLTNDASHDPFCYGLTEEIANGLASVSSVDVVASSSTFQFKDEHVDVREAGRELGVAYIIEGSVRIEDGNTRVIAQLARSLDGVALWSESFDGKMNGILDTQKSIAQKVMENLPLGAIDAAPPSDSSFGSQNA